MRPNLSDLRAHRDAVSSMRDDLLSRANALESAATHIAAYDKSPTKAFVMQSLGRLQQKTSEVYATANVYTRTLDAYLAECEKKG